MFITASDIWQFWTEDRAREESALRLRLSDFPYRAKGERSPPLCFPIQDREHFQRMSQGDIPRLEVAIRQIVFQNPKGQDSDQPTAPRIILCQVVTDEFEQRFKRTHLNGFTVRGSMATSTAVSTIPNPYTGYDYAVTPGRVGVYEADRMQMNFLHGDALTRYLTENPILPLTGWVEDHPRNLNLKRLVAVSQLEDLEYFVRKRLSAAVTSAAETNPSEPSN